MGRHGGERDEVGGLLQGAGRGDIDAFAAFYDRTASLVFDLLRHVHGESAAAERATVRVYARVWRTAPTFDPAEMTGGSFLIEAVHRESGSGSAGPGHDGRVPSSGRPGRGDSPITP